MKLTRLKTLLTAMLVAEVGMLACAADAAEETVVASAERSFWLGPDEIIEASVEATFWLGPGCESCPWVVGDAVTAHVKNGVLVIEGMGAMDDFVSEGSVPWADVADEVTAVTIAKGVTRVGANAWAGMADSVEINGETIAKRQMIAVGFAAPKVPSGAINGAEFERMEIADGKVYLGVSVCTNGNLTSETESWGAAKLDPATVNQSEDGMGLVIPVPATAEKGFMILKSKAVR